MELAFDIMLRTLEGQGPKIESIMRKPLPFTYEDVARQLPEACSIDDTTYLEPGPAVWFPDSAAAVFFQKT